MPPLGITGLNSGLPPNLIENIIAAERTPIKNLEARKGKLNDKLKLVSDLEKRMLSMKDSLKNIIGTGGFKDHSVSLSDQGIVAATINPKGAQKGSWTVEVLELPQSSGRITNGFPDKDFTQVGVGYLEFIGPEGSFDVYINDSNNTLEGIVKAVNESQVGITASVIEDASNEDNPYKIIFSSDKYGNKNKVDFPTIYLLDGDQDFYMDEEIEAQNGKIKLNGFEVQVDAKNLDDVIPGVDLSLLSAHPGEVVQVSVSEDYEAVKGKMEEFVKSMNSVLSFIQQQNNMDENTDTSRTLGGDFMLRNIEMRFKNLLQSGAYNLGPGIHRIQQLGVEFNRQGTLDFDSETFNSVLREDPKAVTTFLRGDGQGKEGFINKIRNMIQTTVQDRFGAVSNRKSDLEKRVERIDRNIERKEKLIGQKEINLKKKFGRLEEKLAQFKEQGKILSRLPQIGSGIKI